MLCEGEYGLQRCHCRGAGHTRPGRCRSIIEYDLTAEERTALQRIGRSGAGIVCMVSIGCCHIGHESDHAALLDKDP